MKKTIIYVIIVLMLGGMFASALPFAGNNSKNVLLLECVDQEVSEALLEQSVDIMKHRLKSLGVQNTEFKISADKASIGINFEDEALVHKAAWFLSSKGDLGFYETANRMDVIKMLQAEVKLLELLHVSQDNWMPAAILGACEKSEFPAIMNELLSLKNQELHDEGILLTWGATALDENQWPLYVLKGDPHINAAMVENASVAKDKRNESASVLIELDQIGGKQFHDLTSQCVAKAVAIVLDNIVYSAPMVQEAISGGKCMISGSFSDNEAAQLAAIISSGELPLDFKVIE